jgi:hypothetical protein
VVLELPKGDNDRDNREHHHDDAHRRHAVHSLPRQGDPRQASGYDAAPYLQGPGWSFRLVDGRQRTLETLEGPLSLLDLGMPSFVS